MDDVILIAGTIQLAAVDGRLRLGTSELPARVGICALKLADERLRLGEKKLVARLTDGTLKLVES